MSTRKRARQAPSWVPVAPTSRATATNRSGSVNQISWTNGPSNRSEGRARMIAPYFSSKERRSEKRASRPDELPKHMVWWATVDGELRAWTSRPEPQKDTCH